MSRLVAVFVVLLGVLAASILLLTGIVQGGVRGAVPALPHLFFGDVTVGAAAGISVPDTTVITAQINGFTFQTSGTVNTTSSGTYGIVAPFRVPGDDPDTLEIIEGGVAGDPIVFLVNGNEATTMVLNGTPVASVPFGSGSADQVNLTVPSTLVSIAVTPATSIIAIGATQQFTATGTFTDGSTQDITGTATWTSTNNAIGTIDAAGLATAVAAGDTTITATSDDIQGTATLTVTAAPFIPGPGPGPAPAPTPTEEPAAPTPTVTPTPSPTPTPTPTVTPTPSPTPTTVVAPTSTPTPTATPAATRTPTPGPTPTVTPTPTPPVVVTPPPVTAGFEVSNLVVEPPQVDAGRPVTVVFRVTNVGDVEGDYEVDMLLDGAVVFTATGSMPPRASRVHNTTVQSPVPGTHTVQVADLAQSFIVRAASIEFSGLQVRPKTVGPRDTVTVIVTVTNTGGTPGTFTANLTVAGVPEDTRTGTLTAGRSRALSFSLSRGEPGRYAVSVDVLSDFFTILAPTVDAEVDVPEEVTISLDVTGVDAEGNIVTATGDTMTISATTIELDLGLTEGVGLASFEDEAAGIKITEDTIEITLARDEEGNATLKLVADTEGVLGTGTTARAEITKLRLVTEEQEIDLTDADPTVGKIAFSVDADLASLPENARLTVIPKKELSPSAKAGFELVARGRGKTIRSVGAAIQIDRENLDNVADAGVGVGTVGEVRLTMAVGPEWVAEQGGVGNVEMTRLTDKGKLEFLATEFLGTDDQGRMVFGAVSPSGFSIFTLVGVAPIPADFIVKELILDPNVAAPNEAVAITIQVINEGGEPGVLSVLLKVNGEPIDTLDISLDPGEEGDVLFFLAQAEEGTYQIEVEEQTASLEVVKSLSPAVVDYVDLSISPNEVGPNEPVTVTLRITNSGDEAGKLDIEVLLNDVLFQIKPTRLPPGVGFSVPIPIAQELPGEYVVNIAGLSDSFTVVKQLVEAALAVSNLSISPAEVKPGDPITIVAIVGNTGDLEGTFDIVLLINEQAESRQVVTVEGKGTIPVIFTATRQEPGTYTVQIEDLTGTFTVVGVPPGLFSVSALQVSPEKIDAGEEVTITVDVANPGDVAGSLEVALKVNGVVEETKEVTVSAGETRMVTFTVTRDEAGVYNVEVDGQTGAFEVTVPSGAPIVLIIVIVLLLLAGGGAAYYFLVIRRKAAAG